MPPEPATKRTIAFIDGQNLYHSVREAFGYTYPNYDVQTLATTSRKNIRSNLHQLWRSWYMLFFSQQLPFLFGSSPYQMSQDLLLQLGAIGLSLGLGRAWWPKSSRHAPGLK
jgi:hypothetical protein